MEGGVIKRNKLVFGYNIVYILVYVYEQINYKDI